MRQMFVDLRKVNKQWMPVACSVKEFWDELERLLKEVEEIASLIKLPLPEYAYQVLLKLRFRPTQASGPFKYQFQPWFNPEAHQAQWHHPEQVAEQLEGYINISHLLRTANGQSWHYGKPVGIKLDPEVDKVKGRALALAYAYLSVPITLAAGWRIPQEYSLLEAREALLGNVRDLVTSHTSFPIISDLPEDHYNGLTFSVVCPHFPEHHYNADSMRTTKLQHKQLEEGESSDMAEDSGSVDLEGNISPPTMKIVEVMDDVQPTGVPVVAPSDTLPSAPEASTSCQRPALRLDTSAKPALLMATLNPTSTINSTQASAVSMTSSTIIIE
jgi:hypothetical protein